MYWKPANEKLDCPPKPLALATGLGVISVFLGVYPKHSYIIHPDLKIDQLTTIDIIPMRSARDARPSRTQLQTRTVKAAM